MLLYLYDILPRGILLCTLMVKLCSIVNALFKLVNKLILLM